MDEAEFDAFYAAAFDRLVTQLHAMIGNRDEAQECVQEAFIRAWSHRRQLARGQAPEAWVRTTAYRLAVSRWRRVVRSRRPADRALEQSGTVAGPTGDRVALVDALARLPEAQRRVLVLHHVCDLSVRQIASETGVAEGTVKARLSRGRAAVRHLLADAEETDDRTRGARHG